jgi:hypothetical protein
MSNKGKKQHRKNFDGKYLAIQSKLRIAKNPIDIISDIKCNYTYDEIKKYTVLLNKLNRYEKLVTGIAFPVKIEELKNQKFIPYLSLDREIFWTACILKIFSTQINEFIINRNNYEKCLLVGNYENAEKILDEIQRKFGYSLWLVENRIGLLQRWKGIEAQKEFVENIKKNESINGIVRYLSYYYSLRAETTVSCLRFDTIVEQAVQEINTINGDLAEYLRFKLNPHGPRRFSRLEQILLIESNSSIVDRLENYIHICQLIISDRNYTQNHDSVKRSLEVLRNRINDYRINTLMFFTGVEDDLKVYKEYEDLMKLIDKYTTGNYVECVNEAYRLMNDIPYIAELYEIYLKSVIRIKGAVNFPNKEGVLSEILPGMLDVLQKNEHTIDSFHKVMKIGYVFCNASWSETIIAFLFKEFYYYRKENLETRIMMGRLNSYSHNPKIGLLIEEFETKSKFFSQLETLYPISPTISLYKIIGKVKNSKNAQLIELGIPENRLIKYEADKYVNDNNLPEAIEKYQKLLNMEDILYQQDALSGIIECYYLSGKLNECLDLVTTKYIENNNIYGKLLVQNVVNYLEKDGIGNYSDNISLPIIYDICANNLKMDTESKKGYAFEDFLTAHSITRPSKLGGMLTEFDINRIIYFLKNISIPQVMDSTILFDNIEEVEDERISVCQLLTDIDQINKDRYFEEISSITQRKLIRKEISKLEQSKIYVDVDGIKKNVTSGLKENFERYQALPDTKISDDLMISIREIIGKEVPILSIPGSEKQRAFISIVRELRDLFVSSNEYGLDCFLSVRIRHNTLLGQLRSPLESENLVTQKDVKGKYQESEYWKQHYSGQDPKAVKDICNALSNFSNEIDELISKLKNIWIQIKTEDKNPNGLFDFTFNELDLIRMQARINKDTKYDELVDMIIGVLWGKTDSSLEEIRNNISTQLKQSVNESFDKLQRKVNNYMYILNIDTLSDSITRARTVLLDELDKIASWFTRTEGAESPDYSVNLPIDISITMLNNAHPNRKIIPIIDIEEKFKLSGKTLKSFVDIIYILLDNVLKHNTYIARKPNLKISCFKTEEKIKIETENTLGEYKDISRENNKLEMIRQQLDKAKAIDSVRMEGGTGFYKIQRIITFDLKCQNSKIDFLITTGGTFRTTIEMDNKGLLA